jgi:hypothetical protein
MEEKKVFKMIDTKSSLTGDDVIFATWVASSLGKGSDSRFKIFF